MKNGGIKIILIITLLAMLAIGTKFSAMANYIYIVGSVIFMSVSLIQCVQTKEYWVILAFGVFLIIVILALCLNALS